MPVTTSPEFTITQEQYEDLAEGYGGICLLCGSRQLGDIEPVAEDNECGYCGEMTVYGIEQALISARVAFRDDE